MIHPRTEVTAALTLSVAKAAVKADSPVLSERNLLAAMQAAVQVRPLSPVYRCVVSVVVNIPI